jgi:hypothetical protein
LGNKIHKLAYQVYSGTAPSGVMRRRDGNHSSQKNNSIQDSVGNEENGYPVPGLNKTMINITKELSEVHTHTHTHTHTKPSQEIWDEISDKFMEEILEMVYQNVQNALKKFQDSKNKEHEKT